MRKLGIVAGVLVVSLMSTGVAQAIRAGSGGRLYWTEWDGDDNVILRSIQIDTDWTCMNAEGSFDDHGLVKNLTAYGRSDDCYAHSPEVYVPASTAGGYGSLMMGLDQRASGELGLMDLLQVTPSAAGHTVTVIGAGVGAGLDTYNNTGRGFIGAPDIAGAFTGSGDAFVVTRGDTTGGDDYYQYSLHIVQDGADGGSHPFDDNAEYLDSVDSLSGYTKAIGAYGNASHDFEIENNRFYMDGAGWSSQTGANSPDGTGGIAYYKRTANTLTREWFVWSKSSIMTQVRPTDWHWWQIPEDTDGDNIVWYRPGMSNAVSYTVENRYGGSVGDWVEFNPSPGFNMSRGDGVAAGQVYSNKPGYEGLHDAVWTLVDTGTWYNTYVWENHVGADAVHSGGGAGNAFIALCVDLNDDGDAMDNEIGEITYIASQTHDFGSDPYYVLRSALGGTSELELVKNTATDNKMWLVLLDTSTGWFQQECLWVIDLEDNGDWAGGHELILTEQTGSTTTGWLGAISGSLAMEYDNPDVFVIPEPGTLLLIGSSALGVVGYIRRRRMK